MVDMVCSNIKLKQDICKALGLIPAWGVGGQEANRQLIFRDFIKSHIKKYINPRSYLGWQLF